VRVATVASAAACATLAVILLVTFWVLLSPVDGGACNTSLLPSAFRDALGPVHLGGAIALSACLWALGAARREAATPGPVTLVCLGAVWVYIGACWADPDLFDVAGFFGVLGGPTIGLVGLLVLGVRTIVLMRSASPADERWRRHALSTQVLVWGCLLLGLPASMGYAWLRGAEAFCF
jgi:hypothetical protein